MDLMLHNILLSNEMKPSVFKPLVFIKVVTVWIWCPLPFHKYEFFHESNKTLGYEIKCMLPLQKKKNKRKHKGIWLPKLTCNLKKKSFE